MREYQKIIRKFPPYFLLTLIMISFFAVVLLEGDEPWSFSRGYLTALVYIAAFFATLFGFANNNRSKRTFGLFLLICTLILTSGIYAFTLGNGYPFSVGSFSGYQSCVPETNSLVNVTLGHTNTIIQTFCNGTNTSSNPFGALWSILLNLLAWFLFIGCLVYAMPLSSEYAAFEKLGQLFRGAAISGAILLNVVGIQVSSGFNSSIAVYGPFNPFVAFTTCDSTTAPSGCVYVNPLYFLVDFGFWFLVTCLASLVLSELYSFFARKNRVVLYKELAAS